MKKTANAILTLAAVAVLIVSGLTYLKSTRAEAQAPAQFIGFVDSDRIVEDFPPANEANTAWDAFQQKSDDDLKAAIVSKFKTDDINSLPRESQLEVQKMIEDSDNSRKAEYEKINREKWEPAKAKIQAAIDGLAKQKGLMVVLEKKTVLSGGVDITNDVLSVLNKPVGAGK